MIRMRPASPQGVSEQNQAKTSSPSKALATENDLSQASGPSVVDLTSPPLPKHSAQSVAEKFTRNPYSIGAVSVRIELLKGTV